MNNTNFLLLDYFPVCPSSENEDNLHQMTHTHTQHMCSMWAKNFTTNSIISTRFDIDWSEITLIRLNW